MTILKKWFDRQRNDSASFPRLSRWQKAIARGAAAATILAAASFPLCFDGTASGVNTSCWTANNTADFSKGTMKNIVVTNLGDLRLSRAVKTILEDNPQITTVNAMIEAPDGSIYAGSGPQGVLLRIKDGKKSTVAVLGENATITSLLFDSAGRLLVSTAGEKGLVFRFDHPDKLVELHHPATDADGSSKEDTGKDAPLASEKPVTIFSSDGVQYVWAMQQTPDGTLYLATGPNGQLFEIDGAGKVSQLFKSDENNLLSLLSDGRDLLYVGTDPNGLIYRVNRKTKDVFVLFNAPESEVDCLALDAQGNLYAGTGAAQPGEQAQANQEQQAQEKEKVGRPESTTGVPLPSEPPINPKPPSLPQPNPGEPHPIPKTPAAPGASAPAAGSAQAGSLIHLAMLMDAPTDPGQGDPNAPGNPPGQPAPPIMPNGSEGGGRAPTSGPIAMPPQEPPSPKQSTEGNAIYRITPDGFVKEVFRRPEMVLSMLEDHGTLLVGTGGNGAIYQVKPSAGETVALAKVEPKDIPSMLRLRDGQVILGFADSGGIASLSGGYAAHGIYTSPVLDATQISLFGKIHLDGSLPADTTLTIATRSGNVQDANKAGWSKWSDEIPATEYIQIPSPSARFLQYRLTMKSSAPKSTPVVDEITVAYQMPNMAPVVKGIKIVPKGEGENGNGPAAPGDNGAPAAATPHPGENRFQIVMWEADDPNGDALQYSLFFRIGSQGPWVLLKDKLTDTHFEWDTRSVADGRYYLKVVASDAAANPPGQGLTGVRISDPLIVDNTPPVIGDITLSIKGPSAHITARIVDRTSTVANCEYSVDSNTDWQAVLPLDKIYDSPEAKVEFALEVLSPGQHQVTLRATDSKGNQSYQTLLVTIEGAAAAAPASEAPQGEKARERPATLSSPQAAAIRRN